MCYYLYHKLLITIIIMIMMSNVTNIFVQCFLFSEKLIIKKLIFYDTNDLIKSL